MPIPGKLETLDDLLAQAEHYANYSMHNSGRVPPTLFLIGTNGPALFMPNSLADESAKNDFAATARLVCIAHAATACVMVLEAWMKCATPDEKLDLTEPPSEAIDRQEIVILMGEARTGQKQKMLPIIRSGNGKFFGFGESDLSGMDQMQGRFAQILSPKAPDERTRLLAQAVLQMKDVMPDQSGDSPPAPRG